MIGIFQFHSIPPDNDYEPPIDLRWGITDEMCGAQRFCSNRVYIPPRSKNQHHFHMGCEALIYFTHGTWRVFRGPNREVVNVQPGDCVYLPVGEPHSYENLDTESPGKELAFYGLIPHRRLADTTFFDDHWVKEGKIIKADLATTEQTIDPTAWNPSLSRGKVMLFKSSEVQADHSFLEPAAVRWLVTRNTCKTEELLAGLTTLAPKEQTGRKQNLGAEMMLFLFKGTLEVRDWLGHPHYVGPETFVYFPKGTAWSIGNPDMWDEAEFFLCYGGINTINATGLVAA